MSSFRNSEEGQLFEFSYRLREYLQIFGKDRRAFVDDVRKFYNIIREQEYEDQGRKITVRGLLSLDEEETFGKYLYQIAKCFHAQYRENIYVFNLGSSKSLKETIFSAFVKGKHMYINHCSLLFSSIINAKTYENSL